MVNNPTQLITPASAINLEPALASSSLQNESIPASASSSKTAPINGNFFLSKKMPELREWCKANNITKYSKKNKKELIQHIVVEIKKKSSKELRELCRLNGVPDYVGKSKKKLIKYILQYVQPDLACTILNDCADKKPKKERQVDANLAVPISSQSPAVANAHAHTFEQHQRYKYIYKPNPPQILPINPAVTNSQAPQQLLSSVPALIPVSAAGGVAPQQAALASAEHVPAPGATSLVNLQINHQDKPKLTAQPVQIICVESENKAEYKVKNEVMHEIHNVCKKEHKKKHKSVHKDHNRHKKDKKDVHKDNKKLHKDEHKPIKNESKLPKLQHPEFSYIYDQGFVMPEEGTIETPGNNNNAEYIDPVTNNNDCALLK